MSRARKLVLLIDLMNPDNSEVYKSIRKMCEHHSSIKDKRVYYQMKDKDSIFYEKWMIKKVTVVK